VDFDEVSLLPSTMRSIKVLTRFSNELARQSVVALDAALRQRLVADVSGKLDEQLLSASGDGVTTPRGLFAHAGVNTVAVNGAVTFDALLDAWGTALSADVNMGNLRWVMTPREFVKLRRVKDTTGRYLMEPDPTLEGVFRIFGVPVVPTSRVPDTTAATPTARIALVDFSQIAVARDLDASVKVLDQTFGQYDQQALRVVTRYDAAPLNAKAVTVLTGITI
jgi:HK97 family phage major capsid protein